MTPGTGRNRRATVTAAGLWLAAILPAGCDQPDDSRVQGYIEGEYVYVASPQAGRLQSLAVARGSSVAINQPLFALDPMPEESLRDEAQRRVAGARANLEDVRKGKRPSEIQSLEAQLQQARTSFDLAEKELARTESLSPSGAATVQDLDRARSTRDQEKAKIAQLGADLETARLGARTDQVTAAEADLKSLEAALAKAEWDLAQKHQSAGQAGLVFDTLYREGEWIAAGRPVVTLLPPQNIKVRAFVSEPKVGTLHVDDSVHVSVDGVSQPLSAKISFISPRAQYTPPVVYSQESRSKFVYMIEAVFDPKDAANLHPGQPVDVKLGN